MTRLGDHLPKHPRILTIDIETRPIVANVWGLWDQNVGLNQIIDPGGVLCFAAKWYGDPQVQFFADWDEGGHRGMVEAAHRLLSEADFLVHYNGVRFDTPHLNWEFAQAGMRPPFPFKQVDLMRTAKARFRSPSNKLDYIAGALGLGHKVKHEGHTLWTKCLAGDEAARRRMERYNKGDVRLTERLYNRLLPWIPNHPNMALYTGQERCCPWCGSKRLKPAGDVVALQNVYGGLECGKCGAFSRGNGIKERATIRAVR